jgi:hypothetical protein
VDQQQRWSVTTAEVGDRFFSGATAVKRHKIDYQTVAYNKHIAERQASEKIIQQFEHPKRIGFVNTIHLSRPLSEPQLQPHAA